MEDFLRSQKIRLVWLGLLAVLVLFLSLPAQAADKYWNTTVGWWSAGSNWNPVGAPQNNDNVYLYNSSADLYRVRYYNNTPTDVYPLLKINATGTGDMKLSLTESGYPANDDLIVSNEYVGIDGRGLVEHSVGTHTVNNTLFLGYQTTGQGTYELSGTGTLRWRTINICPFRRQPVGRPGDFRG